MPTQMPTDIYSVSFVLNPVGTNTYHKVASINASSNLKKKLSKGHST